MAKQIKDAGSAACSARVRRGRRDAPCHVSPRRPRLGQRHQPAGDPRPAARARRDRGGRGRLRQARGAGAGAGAAAGVETAVFPADAYDDRIGRDAAMADWIEARRRRPRRPRRLHAAARANRSSPASATAWSTSTRRCCPPSPASTRSARRWRRACRRPASPSTSSTRASTPGRRSCSARCRCRPGATAQALEAAIHAVEHELYPEAIRMIAEGRVRIDADDPRVVVDR